MEKKLLMNDNRLLFEFDFSKGYYIRSHWYPNDNWRIVTKSNIKMFANLIDPRSELALNALTYPYQKSKVLFRELLQKSQFNNVNIM